MAYLENTSLQLLCSCYTDDEMLTIPPSGNPDGHHDVLSVFTLHSLQVSF